MKFLCQKNYTANINYHDFMASVLYALKIINFYKTKILFQLIITI